MIFLDASSVVAILTHGPEADLFLGQIERARRVYVSAIVLYESAAALARKYEVEPETAKSDVMEFFHLTRAQTVAIDAKVGEAAMATFAAYGKGRHPASLTMGDCFTYACASVYRLPVLFKGDGFPKTDLRSAL